MPDHPDDGDAEGATHRVEIERAPASCELIDHRQHQTGRQAEFEHLGREVQRPLERRCIGHEHEGVRRGDPLDTAVQGIGDDHLVGADRIERVGAG